MIANSHQIILTVPKLVHYIFQMVQHRPLFRLFIKTILQQIKVKKCPNSFPVSGVELATSDYESPPLTTRPGLPPLKS